MGMESFGGGNPSQQENSNEQKKSDIESMITQNNEVMQRWQDQLNNLESDSPQAQYLAKGIENLKEYNAELEKELSELG